MERFERARQAYRDRMAERCEPEESGEHGLAGLDPENNPGELVIALRSIERVMREKGWLYSRAALHYGIRGHPHFREFWPEARYWGDARLAREMLGLPLDDV